ncbi:MAG TPA: hypothetical protein DDW36_03690 [Candidatus Magasanikbacteria bacterium]|nr:hypothetical protein [Candidatus Magasanikbacteria bacterium]
MIFLGVFIISCALSALLTRLWIPCVNRLGIIDKPDATRHLHVKPVPLLGGIPLLISFALIISALVLFSSYLPFQIKLPASSLISVGIGCLIILIGGFFDDKYRLPWYITIIFPFIAVLVVMIGGIHISNVTNPWGGIFSLEQYSWQLGSHTVWWPADIITFLWLLGMSYTTKILDGVDGLATGMVTIGALVITVLALFTIFYQPDMALVALALAGACLGFLFFNFHPATIFLGEGGSIGIGFLLGILAIVSGSKIMTTLLVLAVPVLDVAWAIVRRAVKGQSVARGDRLHVHHRLADAGFGQRGTVIFLYVIGIMFGVAGIFLKGFQKITVLGLLAVFVIIVLTLIHYATRYEVVSKNKKTG